MAQNFSEFPRIFQNFPEFSRIFQNYPELSRIFQSDPGCCSLLVAHGLALAGDCLEAGLDGLHRAPRVARHALEEPDSRLLVEDGVRRAAGVAGHELLDVS